jgi:aarF domain-containing kinase
VEQLFDDFDPQPLASGSIAQVHRATLKPAQYRQYLQQQHPHAQQQVQCADDQLEEQQQDQQVVVKVCHPNVAQHIRLDFKLVGWLSIAASKLPLLRGLPVRESVAQFSHTMTAQTDLRVEAVHALRFHNNFAGVWRAVCGTNSHGARGWVG